MGRVELLAPAGNYESFLGAIHAGADAVYLAGQKFGARAYAGNFTTEELCRAIRYAHLSDRKVYLTLNTLVKESEFGEIKDYLTPFYEEGLDGIIIQDMGVFSYVREEFPRLPLHVSTQATITGVHGANFLKEAGAVRIVPARELSLKEIREIKNQTGLELETFIHGAMCYCYSGQCLFSSIAGGRSGNRGRCAQPCRLPYQLSDGRKSYFSKEAYPLSLKDMCTIQDLPALIDAGIDSFKIEGRMKKPEYAAGVTSIYRKYIDKYYENNYNDSDFKVSSEDMHTLSSLYIRSEIQNGYYFKHNDKDMISLNSPAYSGSDERLLSNIRQKFLTPEKRHEAELSLFCKVGEPLTMTLSSCGHTVTVKGPLVEAAQKQPAEVGGLHEKISKFGNTFFEVKDCQVLLEGNCFVPIKVLNDLRREAVVQLEDAILKQKSDIITSNCGLNTLTKAKDTQNCSGLCALVTNEAQLRACMQRLEHLKRIYLDADFFLKLTDTGKFHKEQFCVNGHRISIYIALPFIIRKRDELFLEKLYNALNKCGVDGCLVRNPEEAGWLNEKKYQGKIAFDAGMYSFNSKAIKFYQSFADTICLPYELKLAEKKQLMENIEEHSSFEQVVYGRIPMMITANCLVKTGIKCENKPQKLMLTDRYKHQFPVENVCSHCYNIIWNCLPLSLHGGLKHYQNYLMRLQFSTESENDTGAIIDYFSGQLSGASPKLPECMKEYTTGHEKRGVE